MTTRNIWRSNRLIFRSVEPTDEAFLSSLNDDGSVSFQNASPNLPVPQGPRSAVQFREFLQSNLLGCIICLPPETPTESSNQTSFNSNTTTNTTITTEPNNQPPKDNNNSSKPQPTPIGIIHLMSAEATRAHHRATELGISIHPAHQSRGYGSEAILWALEFAFKHANLHRVAIGAFAWNEGAWKLYERLGFVIEGRARGCIWYDGEWCDMVHLGMLSEEWWGRYGGRGEALG